MPERVLNGQMVQAFRIDVWPRSRITVSGVILRGDPEGKRSRRVKVNAAMRWERKVYNLRSIAVDSKTFVIDCVLSANPANCAAASIGRKTFRPSCSSSTEGRGAGKGEAQHPREKTAGPREVPREAMHHKAKCQEVHA